MQEIKPPKTCPSCNSNLVWVNQILYCKNTECGEQASKKVEHFAKVLKIKGLGPSTISKLGFTTTENIYEATLEYIEDSLQSKKIADKLKQEIEASKRVPANILLAAFSIPLIGTTAANKLAEHCVSITDINEKTCKAAGLGPKATESLLTWLENNNINTLPFDFKFEHKVTKKDRGIVCISGKLKSFKTKAEATKALEDAGYTVKSTVTKDVTILINESGIESTKTEKARNSGVQIITDIGDLI